MPGFVIDDRAVEVPSLPPIINYYDDRRLKLRPGHSMRARVYKRIKSLVDHNTKNIETCRCYSKLR